MTVDEIARQAWEEAGDPTDIDPFTGGGGSFDATTAAGIRFLRYINTGIVRIAHWRYRDGTLLRLRTLQARKRFLFGTPYAITPTAGTGFIITYDSNGLGPDETGLYDGWVAEVSAGTGIGQRRIIMSSSKNSFTQVVTLNLDQELETDLDGTSEIELTKNFAAFSTVIHLAANQYIPLDSSTEILDVMKIRDLASQLDLARVDNIDGFTSGLVQTGTPTQYRLYGNELWMDVIPDSTIPYEILYIRHPPAVSSGPEVPGIPAQYHEAVALWVTHNLHRLYQDFEKAYAVKRELEDIMAMVRNQGASDMDMEQGGLTVWG